MEKKILFKNHVGNFKKSKKNKLFTEKIIRKKYWNLNVNITVQKEVILFLFAAL
jgi:hypothetical protein